MPTNCQLGSIVSYGSEGVVYHGTWCGTPAAIKVFTKHHARRAETEMKLVSNLNHINIIKYFGLENEQATAYLAMEYITGGNLYEFIKIHFNLSSYWTIITRILTDVARGMIYLHDRSIIQGDLKSHNILLQSNTHQAVICDFGISRLLDNDIQTKKRNCTTKGTIRWMAPEICMPPPEPSSRESDVWSYGCIVLETTSGCEPWMTQFGDDVNLFRALQRRENASIFAGICANQSSPPHIRELLIQCCSWLKVNRPHFIDILNSLDTTHGNDAFIGNTIGQILHDLPLYDSQSSSGENDKEKHRKFIFNDADGPQRLSSPPLIQTAVNNFKESSSKFNGYRGRQTGEIYTSTGSASGRSIYEGPKGGLYYLTENGSKVYLHK